MEVMIKTIFKIVFIVSAIFIADTMKTYAQIGITVQNDTVPCNNPTVFTLSNPDSIDYYCRIELEKYDSDIGFYKYSGDVFAEDNVKRELTLRCPTKNKIRLSFIIPKSSLLIEENGILRELTPSETEMEKLGIFRLKIIYGIIEKAKTRIIYSKPFIISERSTREPNDALRSSETMVL